MNDLVWVHMDGWAGHMKYPGFLLKRNPSRSRVRYKYRENWIEGLVPNRAISERSGAEYITADRETPAL